MSRSGDAIGSQGWFRQPWDAFDVAVIALSVAASATRMAVLRLARLARVAKMLHLARHASQLRLLALARR